MEEAGWTVDGESAVVPGNGDNDVKAGVVKENIELGREFPFGLRCGAGGMIRLWPCWGKG